MSTSIRVSWMINILNMRFQTEDLFMLLGFKIRIRKISAAGGSHEARTRQSVCMSEKVKVLQAYTVWLVATSTGSSGNLRWFYVTLATYRAFLKKLYEIRL
jgi:hypothetical protein